MTSEFFSANKRMPDQLEPRCKDCRKKDRPRKKPALEATIDGYKRCRSCLTAKPATLEYFYSNKNRPYNLTDHCKSCLQARYRKHPPKPPTPKGFKRCTICDELKPATTKHFWLKGRSSWCIPCTRIKHKQQYLNAKESRQQKHALYRIANREHYLELQRRWRKENPDRIRVASQRRRARKQKNGGNFTAQDIKEKFSKQKGQCYYCNCKLDKYHIDHVIPVSKGGSNNPDNLVLACPTCNRSKGAKLPHEWAKGNRLL